MKSVAIYEAKARLSELLAAVQAGEEFEITRHGKPMAWIVAPRPAGEGNSDVTAVFARLKALGEGVVLEGDIKEIIAEGRR
jgi:prevent-host-death family protein